MSRGAVRMLMSALTGVCLWPPAVPGSGAECRPWTPDPWSQGHQLHPDGPGEVRREQQVGMEARVPGQYLQRVLVHRRAGVRLPDCSKSWMFDQILCDPVTPKTTRIGSPA